MKQQKKFSLSNLFIFIAAMLIFTACSDNNTHPDPDFTPIIYFHGADGSAAPFEAQAMRFTSNGYPQSHLAIFG